MNHPDHISDIRSHITNPKFKDVCMNIAKKTQLGDDLYQELMLCLLEKIMSKNAAIIKAWKGGYIDWFIIRIAHVMFNGNRTVMDKYFTYTSDLTDDIATIQDTNNDYENTIRICNEELDKIYWYNSKLFRQYTFEGDSVRTISQKTGIPYPTIHKDIVETRKCISNRVKHRLNDE